LQRNQNYSLFGVPTKDDQRVGPLEIGPARGFCYDSEAGAPGFFSPDYNISATAEQYILNITKLGRLGSDTQLDQASRTEIRSGEMVNGLREDRHLSAASDAELMSKAENQLLQKMGEMLGKKEFLTSDYSRAYRRQIDVADLAALKQIQAPPSVVAPIMQMFVGAILRSRGINEVRVEEIVSKITEQSITSINKPEVPLVSD
jgi:hypothetical protein